MNEIALSSITKKLLMALAGMFLLLFLPIHLYVNLLLLSKDPENFNKAAKFMANFPVIRAFEVVLIAAFMVHIIWALIVQIQNWLARPAGYVKSIRSETSFFSRFMIWTGLVIFIFLILHFFNFYFIKLGLVRGNPDDYYTVAYNLFKIPAYNYIYLVSFAFLGFHLYHALYSAFQTVGLNHRIRSPVVRIVAVIYAFVIPVGFAYISISIWLFR